MHNPVSSMAERVADCIELKALLLQSANRQLGLVGTTEAMD